MNSARLENSHATATPLISTPLTAGPMAGVLVRMLDEIDYGLLLVTASGALRFANQLALRALGGGGALRLAGGAVFAARDADQTLLRIALCDAGRGLRRLLTLNPAGANTSVAVLPLPAQDSGFDPEAAAEPMVMLVLGKQSANQTLTLDFFARTHKLTSAETAVLHALCAGQSPKQAAVSLCVAISTVRTQIGSIRLKTQTASLRELADKVAALPPITPAMKTAVCH
jgi:DNA-binding CsgD family transcriptional regulator